jgi:hypothetical protein
MKKMLLTVALATTISFGAFAQNYWYLKTTGTTSEYENRKSTGTSVVIAAEAAPKTKVLSAAQTMPFTWSFYGQTVTSYRVSTSGYVTFDAALSADSNTNVALPSLAAPASSIFAFWDNLRVYLASGVNSAFPQGVRTWTYGTAPNRVHVVQWQLTAKDDGAADLTNISQFAIRFYEANGGTKFDIVHNFGGGTLNATAGVQNATRTIATQVAGSPTLNFGGATGSDVPAQHVVYTFNYGVQPAFNVKMRSVDAPATLLKGNATNFGYDFINYGSATITTFRVNYSVNGGATVSENVTGASVSGSGVGSYAFSHATSYDATTSGGKTIKMWVDNINGANADMDNSDDTASTIMNVVNTLVQRKTLLEMFTSSTCPPCVPGNENMQNAVRERMGGFTVIKYQYNFPGTGDPYYTLEGGSRGSYYGGINSVPRLQIDGQWNGNPASDFDLNVFDNYYNQLSVVTIKASQVIEGKKITINAKIKPTGTLVGNYKVHFAVLEKLTKKNKKSNGETEFYWVMKKMLPDANGTIIDFTSDAEQTISKSFTFPGNYRLPTSAVTSTGAYNGTKLETENSVEDADLSELIGVVFVQDENNKFVLQSEWSGNNEWDYWTGIKETAFGASGVTMYPNPAQTKLTINASDAKSTATVKIVDLTGKEVLTANAKGGIETALDCSALNNGIYIVHISVEGTTSTQKLVISK